MIELKGGQAMWYMIDYENVHEQGLYGIEMLKEDDKIFVFYNMGDKENIENSKLKKAAEKGISIQYVVLYKTGKNALDFYIASKIGEICGQGTQQDIAVISRDKNQQFFHGKLLFCTQFYIIKIIQHRAANRKKKSPLLGKEEAIFAGQDSTDLRGRIRRPPLHL